MLVKKTTAWIAAIGAASALTMAGCSSADTEPDDGTMSLDETVAGDQSLELMFWNWGPAAEEGWRTVADLFIEENPGVTIELNPVAGDNWGTYLANASTQIAGGAEPDLIYTATEGVKYLASNDLLVSVDSYLEEDSEGAQLVDDMAENLLAGMSSDGELWALPYAWNNMVVYYNTERFAEAGLDAPDPDWTWDDFEAAAAALTEDADSDGQPEKFGFAWASNEIFPGVLPWVINAGGNLTSEDRCTATVDTPEMSEAISFLHGMIYEDKVAAAPQPLAEIFPQFQNGTIAMFGAGRWPEATFKAEGFESFDIAKWPTGDTYETVFGVGGFPILKTSPNPDLAWEFQKFTLSDTVQNLSIGTSESPSTDIPAKRSVADQLATLGGAPSNAGLYYSSVEDYDAIDWFPAPSQYSEFESAFLRNIGLIFGDEVTVEQGLADMQTELEGIVSCG